MPDARRLTDPLVAEAQAIWDEDRAMCERSASMACAAGPDGSVVLTHCNAGSLATGGIGTALAPVYRAHEAGRRVHVICRRDPAAAAGQPAHHVGADAGRGAVHR